MPLGWREQFRSALWTRWLGQRRRRGRRSRGGDANETLPEPDHGRPRRTIATSLLPRDASLTPETALQRGFLRWAILGSNPTTSNCGPRARRRCRTLRVLSGRSSSSKSAPTFHVEYTQDGGLARSAQAAGFAQANPNWAQLGQTCQRPEQGVAGPDSCLSGRASFQAAGVSRPVSRNPRIQPTSAHFSAAESAL